jgi:hypothetical protein
VAGTHKLNLGYQKGVGKYLKEYEKVKHDEWQK